MNPTDNWWDEALAGVSNADIQSYIDDYGITPESPSDPKVIADVTTAKANAQTSGNTKLTNTLDFILKYGDKALTILTKNGILQNKNLSTTGYSDTTLAALLAGTKTDAVNNAPDTSSRVFNIDFTDPKVLIITFLIIMILAYFLFFKSSKNGKR